jgi:hypothetical protein
LLAICAPAGTMMMGHDMSETYYALRIPST